MGTSIKDIKRYPGERTVIRYWPDDTIPLWRHIVGSPHLDENGVPSVDADGNAILITSATCEPNCTGDTEEAANDPSLTICMNCRSRPVKEEIWDGAAQYKTVDGALVYKTADELAGELKDRILVRTTAAEDLAGALTTSTLDLSS